MLEFTVAVVVIVLLSAGVGLTLALDLLSQASTVANLAGFGLALVVILTIVRLIRFVAEKNKNG